MPYTPPTPNWVGPLDRSTDLVQTPDDGDLDLSWGYKLRRKYEGDYDTIVTLALGGAYNRGIVSDGYVIDNASVRKSRGRKGRVEIDWQSIGGYLNPDEWQITPEDLQPKIERHPLYDSLTVEDINEVRQAAEAYNTASFASAYAKVNTGSNSALKKQLYGKIINGMDTYYLSAYRYSWSQYFLSGHLPVPDPGGKTYAAPAGPAGFILPVGFSWLRLADEAGQANWSPLGGIEKITYHWLGAPDGHWDPDVYPPA